MQALINVGLMLHRMREKNLNGFSHAAAYCHTNAKNLDNLSQGELPRMDALQLFCK